MKLRISPLSDKKILKLSSGEVTSHRLLDARTQQPHEKGLFSQRIFGPLIDYVCICKHLIGKRHAGKVCEKCGVMIGRAKVLRSSRRGHITLPVPLVNPLATKPLSLLFNLTQAEITRVSTGAGYIRINDSDDGPIMLKNPPRRVVLEIFKFPAPGTQRSSLPFVYLGEFIDLKETYNISKTLDNPTRESLLKDLYSDKQRIENWLLSKVLVPPPSHRPLLMNESNKIISDSRNQLYSRLIARKQRFERALNDLPNIQIILQQMLCQMQVALNSVYGGKIGENIPGILDLLSGKSGLLRKNLLGKRLDYSARAMITPGPNLALDEVGLPRRIAYELYKPFILHELIKNNKDCTIKKAIRMHDTNHDCAVTALEHVMKNRWVIINRQPTLHKFGLMAFKAVLHDDLVLRIPPLLCSPFNADFDGDTMAIHAPLRDKAKEEAKTLMSPAQALNNPMNGEALIKPSHEMVLGLYFMSKMDTNKPVRIEQSFDRLMYLYESTNLRLGECIIFRKGTDESTTCIGRLILENILGVTIKTELTKKNIGSIIEVASNNFTNEEMLCKLKEIQDISFAVVTQQNLTLSIKDFQTPSTKNSRFEQGYKHSRTLSKSVRKQEINKEDAYERKIRRWDTLLKKLYDDFIQETDELNPLLIMEKTGARASKEQIAQLVIAKGLTTDTSNKIIEDPIKGSLFEGLDPFEYIQSCQGARKSMADKIYTTPLSGYLARRMVFAARDLYIVTKDCRTKKGIQVKKSDVWKGRKILSEQEDFIIVRSPILCEAKRGICQVCYGLDLSTRNPIAIGSAIGCVAAQSLTEPATQMSLRTFHTSGSAVVNEQSLTVRAKVAGTVRKIVNKGSAIVVQVDDSRYWIHKSASIEVKEKEKIEEGRILAVYTTNNMENDDIVGKLIVIEKYFELNADKKKGIAVVALEDGVVSFKSLEFGIQVKIGEREAGCVNNSPILVREGEIVKKGRWLSQGELDVDNLYETTGNLALVAQLFIERMLILYAEEGVNISPVHIETIFRSMSETIITTDGKVGLRRFDKYKKKNVLLLGISDVSKTSPSWLKSAGFGWVKAALAKPFLNTQTSYDLPVERIMSGQIPLFDINRD